MDDLRIFRGDECVVNEYLTIRHPTVGEICDYGEEKYFSMARSLCSTPSDCKVFLNDTLHIDFTTISDFDMFKMICGQFTTEQTSILFGEKISFPDMYMAKNNQTDEVVLVDPTTGFIVDEHIYIIIMDYLRKIHAFEKVVDNPGNDYTKKWMIDKARKLQQRQQNKKNESFLLPLISAMANCRDFKYDHQSVWGLPIYTFMDSVRRIQKTKNFDQTMQGIYAGTIDSKKISMESLNWLGTL